MGGDGSQKLLPWRGISFLSGAQTSGSQQNQHQHCTGKLGRISVGGWLSYTRPGSFLEITPGSILASAEAQARSEDPLSGRAWAFSLCSIVFVESRNPK